MARRLVASAMAVLIAALVSIPITLIASPWWRYFEAATGIESYGHSGPAQWCYLMTWGCLSALLLFWRWRAGRSRTPTATPSDQ